MDRFIESIALIELLHEADGIKYERIRTEQNQEFEWLKKLRTREETIQRLSKIVFKTYVYKISIVFFGFLWNVRFKP